METNPFHQLLSQLPVLLLRFIEEIPRECVIRDNPDSPPD